jgi:ketosteroid isomerase-like protein
LNDLVVEVEAVFAEFQKASRSGEWQRFERLFLPTFFSLDPATAAPVDRQMLIAFLPRRRELFQRAGASGTKLTAIDVTALDPIHAQARTTWTVEYDRPHHPVTLRSTFTLRRTDDGWRIAVYHNHESLLQLLGLETPAVSDRS